MRVTTLFILTMFFFSVAAEAASVRGKTFYGSLVVGSGFHNTFNFGRGFPSYLRSPPIFIIGGTPRTISGLSATSSSSPLSGYAHQPTNSDDITFTAGVDDPDVIVHALRTSSNLRSITINGDIASLTPILHQAGVIDFGGVLNINTSGPSASSSGPSISQTGIVGGGGGAFYAVNNNPILPASIPSLTSGSITLTPIISLNPGIITIPSLTSGSITLTPIISLNPGIITIPSLTSGSITLTGGTTLGTIRGFSSHSNAAPPVERVGKPGYVIAIEAGVWVAPYLRVDMSIGYRSYKIKAEGIVTERTASNIPLTWNAAFYPMYLVESHPNALSDFFITFGAGVGFWDAEDRSSTLQGGFADNISGSLTTGAGYEYYIDNSASIGLEYEFAWNIIDSSLGATKEQNVSHSILLVARYDF